MVGIMDHYKSPYGGAESKESGADGKFFAGQTAERIELFKRPPKFEVFGKLGHLPSQYHAFLCGNLYRGIDGWMAAIEYADKMIGIEYPVHLIYPEGWDGPKPNPFHSYDEYEDQFLKPILTDVKALQEILRKHRIGELTKQQADDAARRTIVAQPAKQGGDRKSEDYKSNHNLCFDSQVSRAASNGVHKNTQLKLDRLAKDRPDLLEKVCSGQLSVNRAAIQAGIVKQLSNLDLIKKQWLRLSESERGEFLSWMSNDA